MSRLKDLAKSTSNISFAALQLSTVGLSLYMLAEYVVSPPQDIKNCLEAVYYNCIVPDSMFALSIIAPFGNKLTLDYILRKNRKDSQEQ